MIQNNPEAIGKNSPERLLNPLLATNEALRSQNERVKSHPFQWKEHPSLKNLSSQDRDEISNQNKSVQTEAQKPFDFAKQEALLSTREQLGSLAMRTSTPDSAHPYNSQAQNEVGFSGNQGNIPENQGDGFLSQEVSEMPLFSKKNNGSDQA